MNTFQTVILGVFVFFLVLGFLAFSGILPFLNGSKGETGIGGTVNVWGSLPREYITPAIRALNQKNKDIYAIAYREIREENFDTTLVEALASNTGPDIILLPQDLIIRHQDKVFPISYKNFSERDFKDTFIEEGELYLRDDGILAFPFSIDPLVMYWNRDMFVGAGIANTPETWDEFSGIVPRLTKTDEAFNIQRSGLAFGEYRNINHAKALLSMLIIQSGNPIVEKVGGSVRVALREQRKFVTSPAQSSLRFYTEFSNPVKPVYSWNRALPRSENFFTSGDLAMYFGYASEYKKIKDQNPHLNFDVALVPQTQNLTIKATFGRMTGLALLLRSQNIPTAFLALKEMTSRDFLSTLSLASNLPPVRRDLLTEKQTGATQAIFYQSALLSRAWLDPEPNKTGIIFRTMVEDVVSGRSKISSAVERAHKELVTLFKGK